MATKTSAVVTLLGLLFVLGMLIATSDARRKKGKFVTAGGSHCKYIEKKRHNGTDVSYTLVCKCHTKGGGTMRYSCHYRTSVHGGGKSNHEFSESFLQLVKGTGQLVILVQKPCMTKIGLMAVIATTTVHSNAITKLYT